MRSIVPINPAGSERILGQPIVARRPGASGGSKRASSSARCGSRLWSANFVSVTRRGRASAHAAALSAAGTRGTGFPG